MRKQHLAEFVVDYLAARIGRKRHVFQGKPLRFFVKIAFQIDAAKRRTRRNEF